jgi:hypothetical protein
MPNCKVYRGSRITPFTGDYAGRQIVVRELIEPTAGEQRGCTIVKAAPKGASSADAVYLSRNMYQVLGPLRPKNCLP